MHRFTEWFPPVLVGVVFTALAGAKLFGALRGIVGGGDKSWSQRCLGSCPTWSRRANRGLVVLFLMIGLVNLAWAVALIAR
jgi:hypothetical protein